MGKYEGKVVLVTGSRRGVGKFISEHFLAEGATVLGFARGEATIEHERYHHFQVNLANTSEIMNTFVKLRKPFPTIHILVNNAAELTSQYALIMSAEVAKSMIDINLLGAFTVTREVAKLMRKAKWGRIINIGSMAVSVEAPGDAVYAACKAGLATMGNIMAREFDQFNITVNMLSITAIETDMLAQLPKDTIQSVVNTLPQPRFAKPDDILNILDFFASERSSAITSQNIFLGGVH